MNLVTGIMVESAIELTREDQEAHRAFELEKKTQLIKKVRIMFEQMDTDGSGEVDMSEIRSASPECQEMLAEVIDINDMEDFIRTLDADGSGTIGIDEFCDGMIKAQGLSLGAHFKICGMTSLLRDRCTSCEEQCNS